MDFSKINGDIKPKETPPNIIKKKEEVSISFSDLLSSPKKTYIMPTLGETSISSGYDEATISEGAKTAYYLSKILSMVKDVPDVREEKINEAIKLLKGGIDSPRINKGIVERITTVFFPE
ncbi:MAG: flagellar biosynthesis anti-sigma factor FlgM [bacterium]